MCDSRLTMERSEEHTSELQSLMRIPYAVFCLKKKKQTDRNNHFDHGATETPRSHTTSADLHQPPLAPAHHNKRTQLTIRATFCEHGLRSSDSYTLNTNRTQHVEDRTTQ